MSSGCCFELVVTTFHHSIHNWVLSYHAGAHAAEEILQPTECNWLEMLSTDVCTESMGSLHGELGKWECQYAGIGSDFRDREGCPKRRLTGNAGKQAAAASGFWKRIDDSAVQMAGRSCSSMSCGPYTIIDNNVMIFFWFWVGTWTLLIENYIKTGVKNIFESSRRVDSGDTELLCSQDKT